MTVVPFRRNSPRSTDRMEKGFRAPPVVQTAKLIGYARVSTDDQNCAAQVHALQAAGCVEIVTEHGSGADQHRPALARLLATLQPGEVLTIVRLDRLARSVAHLVHMVAELEKRGIGLKSLSDPIDTTSPGGRFALHVLGAVAELERALIIERTRAGVAAARRAGRLPGNPRLIARDPDETLRLAQAKTRRGNARTLKQLGEWPAMIENWRRQGSPWHEVAARIAQGGGPNWSGERLRRAWQRLSRD